MAKTTSAHDAAAAAASAPKSRKRAAPGPAAQNRTAKSSKSARTAMRNDDDDEDDEDYMDNDEVDRRGGNGAGRRSGGQATMSSSSGSDPFLSNLLAGAKKNTRKIGEALENAINPVLDDVEEHARVITTNLRERMQVESRDEKWAQLRIILEEQRALQEQEMQASLLDFSVADPFHLGEVTARTNVYRSCIVNDDRPTADNIERERNAKNGPQGLLLADRQSRQENKDAFRRSADRQSRGNSVQREGPAEEGSAGTKISIKSSFAEPCVAKDADLYLSCHKQLRSDVKTFVKAHRDFFRAISADQPAPEDRYAY
ncbi:hypothetical protein EMMF5_003100 [Cystobasidiomycetes sp. EMM_F5]